MKELMITLVNTMGELFHKHNLILVVTVFLSRNTESPIEDLETYSSLSENVDFLNIMVYDFLQDGSHAPLEWGKSALSQIENNSNIPLSKVLLGIPFYGYKFAEKEPVPLMGTDLVKLLGKSESPKPLFKWNPATAEHSVTHSEYVGKRLDTKTAVFPTLFVLNSFF